MNIVFISISSQISLHSLDIQNNWYVWCLCICYLLYKSYTNFCCLGNCHAFIFCWSLIAILSSMVSSITLSRMICRLLFRLLKLPFGFLRAFVFWPAVLFSLTLLVHLFYSLLLALSNVALHILSNVALHIFLYWLALGYSGQRL